ncbi:MAG TPA: hypothetical protein VGG75_33895 [Trebonia sp.]|jgi:hypothetical protein
MTKELPAECQKLISRQRGVIACSQASAHGLDRDWVKGQARYGIWQRLERGVYATFAGEPSREAELWAALLRAGIDDAVLSHYTAAERHGLPREPNQSIHVAVPEDHHPARWTRISGIVVHRSDAIVATCHPAKLPRCTRFEDTILDILKITKGFDAKYDWVRKAISDGRTTPERLLASLSTRVKYPDRENVQLMLGYAADGIMSWLELQWANGVEKPHGLPVAQRQVRVALETGNCYLDNLYEPYRLCVELDGRAAHPESEQGRDKERDRRILIQKGIYTMHYETKHLHDAEHQCQAAAEMASYFTTVRGTDQPESIGHPCSGTCPVGRPLS